MRLLFRTIDAGSRSANIKYMCETKISLITKIKKYHYDYWNMNSLEIKSSQQICHKYEKDFSNNKVHTVT